jgi:hypothetical protein
MYFFIDYRLSLEDENSSQSWVQYYIFCIMKSNNNISEINTDIRMV